LGWGIAAVLLIVEGFAYHTMFAIAAS
jgi:hypothetical protein